MQKRYSIFLLFLLFAAGILFCEEPITAFDEKFAVSIFGNHNIGIFKQEQTQGFKTDMPWRIGLGFRYKKFSAFFSVPINFKFNSFDVELNSYFEKLYFESYLKRYKNYYDTKENENKNIGLDIISAGILAGWIHNNQNHSLSSVYSLNEKQNISSGSFLYGFGVYYTSLYSDNMEINRYNERNHILHFGPTAGYSYTWVLSYDIFINIGINIGANLGINTTENKILFIPQVKPKVSFGHHNRTWSINAVMGNNAAILLRNFDEFDVVAPATITVTFSKRF
ncbi:MAG: hypothetical protein Pg6C_17350 [Treponemataceae bacterium]|nr:MAG: hypothetical protein Pg6C_17350 [Treponemataceae bacterium]